MKISKVKLNNFRIYKRENEINFLPFNEVRNINLIAGKNGFGKTTFLISLIWCLYGKMMIEVEDKYKRDIRNAGGYEKFLWSLANRDFISDLDLKQDSHPKMFVEIEIQDLSIPSMPCESVIIKRSFNLKNNSEELEILIDGLENELAKEVGLEVFINDFILPREIAKFFFFDDEKIVSLAEAKSKSELKSLSRAYSEVLGIKKYEDLKKNLETLLSKIQRSSAQPIQKSKLEILLNEENELMTLIELNKNNKIKLESEIAFNVNESDHLQEQLIREGNGISVEELKELKVEQDELKLESDHIKGRLKRMLDLLPLVMAGNKIITLNTQLENESYTNSNLNINISKQTGLNELILNNLNKLNFSTEVSEKIINVLERSFEEYSNNSESKIQVLLDYTPEQSRAIKAVLDNIRSGFNIQFQNIVREEKNNRVAQSRILFKIKQAEARKDNAIVQKLRIEKLKIDQRIMILNQEKGSLSEESKSIEQKLVTTRKNISELQKHINVIEADRAKVEVTEKLLVNISKIITRIKEEKKYSLQKSILLGLSKLMHKQNFVKNIRVNVYEDIIDIDLLDAKNNVIEKESLSKGEQQLYATALLKALVDESGIKFPIFIDSPLQKFDKYHAENIIKEFYPSISDQVVLFPLLEKELSEEEYEYLKPNLNKVYMINNNEGFSSLKSYKIDTLFNEFNKEENYVHAN